jgi:hypothetical protein
MRAAQYGLTIHPEWPITGVLALGDFRQENIEFIASPFTVAVNMGGTLWDRI